MRLKIATVLVLILCLPALAASTKDEFAQAMVLLRNKHTLEARQKLQLICQRPDATAYMYCELADTYTDIAAIEDNSPGCASARRGLLVAIQKDPQCGSAYRGLATFANLRGNYAEAVPYCNKALSVKEPDYNALRQRALAYSHLNKLEDAEKDTEEYIKHGHALSINYMLLGDLQQALKRYPDAEKSYRTAMASSSTFRSRCFNQLIKCLNASGKIPEVVAEISSHLASDPTDPEMLDLRSQYLMKEKKYQEALRDCSAAIKESPLSLYYTHRAAAYDALGQKKLADEDRATAEKKSGGEFDKF